MPDYGFTVKATNLVSANLAEAENSISKFTTHAEVATKEVGEHFELMGERMTETFKNLKSLLLTGLGITALFEGWEFIENSKEAFEGLEKQVARLDTVLKSTKFAAGFSSSDIQAQAREISKTIVNSRQEILQAQGTLLSNTNIRGDTFKKALQASADYSTFFGTDMATGAKLLGRALQDPLQGMNSLRRLNIIFSDEQKKQIKNYESQGQLVKAQAVLLEEINKKFSGQAQAFALTDAGKIQVARKQWEELEFKLGEIISRVEVSLIPSFTKIVNVIKTAFNSSIIQYFIEHIKDLVGLIIKIIPIWVLYRVALAATNLVMASYIAFQEGLTGATVASTTATVEATAAVEGLNSAFVSTAVGAFAIGIGYLIGKIISFNEEFSKSIEKITKFQATQEKLSPIFKSASDTWASYNNDAGYGKDLKGEVLANAISNKGEAEKALKLNVNPNINETTKEIARLSADIRIATEKSGQIYDGIHDWTQRVIDDGFKRNELLKQLSGLKDMPKYLQGIINQSSSIITDYKKQGIIPIGYTAPGAGHKADSFNTSNLSGASGGLGQAREVKIYFQGPFQQNVGVKESKEQAEKAIEKLTEMISGFSQSVNSQ